MHNEFGEFISRSNIGAHNEVENEIEVPIVEDIKILRDMIDLKMGQRDLVQDGGEKETMPASEDICRFVQEDIARELAKLDLNEVSAYRKEIDEQLARVGLGVQY